MTAEQERKMSRYFEGALRLNMSAWVNFAIQKFYEDGDCNGPLDVGILLAQVDDTSDEAVIDAVRFEWAPEWANACDDDGDFDAGHTYSPWDADPANVDPDDLRGWLEAQGHELERREPFEWWAVAGWLGRALEAHGEIVVDGPAGPIWGRCTTGQSFLLDGVIQTIYGERNG